MSFHFSKRKAPTTFSPIKPFGDRRVRVKMGFMAGVGAIGSIAGGLIGGSGAAKAAKKAANIAASQAWSDAQQQELAYEDQQPFRNLGTASANRLAMLSGLGALPGVERRFVPQNYNDPFFNETPAPYLGFGTEGGAGSTVVPGAGSGGISATTGSQSQNAVSQGTTADKIRADQEAAFALFQTDPGYQFRQDEGLKAVERSAAAKGGALSGATMKGLERFAEGTAGQEYGNHFNRLLSMAGFGPVATAASANSSLGFSGLEQQARLAEGNARGSGYAQQASSMNSGINNLLSVGSYYGNQGGGNSWLNNLFSGGSGVAAVNPAFSAAAVGGGGFSGGINDYFGY